MILKIQNRFFLFLSNLASRPKNLKSAMPKTPKPTFSFQNSDFRFKFFFYQNLDFVLGQFRKSSNHIQGDRFEARCRFCMKGNPWDFLGQLKKNLANKIFGYLARCEFWLKLGLRFWILVGYVDFLAKFGANSGFRG